MSGKSKRCEKLETLSSFQVDSLGYVICIFTYCLKEKEAETTVLKMANTRSAFELKWVEVGVGALTSSSSRKSRS